MYLHGIDIICLIFVILLYLPNVQSNARLIADFRSNSRIHNIIYSDNKIYIGAINNLYSVDSKNLTLFQDITTGPILDSPYCNPDLSSCIGSSHNIQETDNYNKILHRLPDGLLLCGSVRQGICEIRSVDNLNRVIRNGSSPVAANSKDASTVSLVDDNGEKLYVAATYSYESPYREGFPAVATRLAPTFLPINSGHIDGEAAVHIRAEYKSRFKIRYVSAFKDEHYIYWASIQKKYVQAPSISNPLVSKLIRICKDDDKYVSYSEIEIQCRGEDNTNFNILKSMTLFSDQLIGVFTDAQEKMSAVCIYNMPKIRITFWYNIDRCRGGTDTIGLPHIGRDSKCINKSHLPLAEDTCLLGVGGTIEVSQVASIQYADRILTSVAARAIQEHVIVVIGTAGGEVLQFALTGEHDRKLTKYTEFVSGPDAVSKIDFLDDKRYYVVSENELSIFRVSICGQHSTCNQCTSNRDPLCGWCLLEGKCSAQAECQSSILYQCPRLDGDVFPPNISVDAPSNTTIFIPLTQLPAPEDDKSYECYFGAFKSLASWSEEGLRCPLPEQRPRLPKQPITGLDTDHVKLVLSLRSPFARANIVEHNFTFFDCGHNTICSTCTNSAWSCRWCAADKKCLSPEATCSKTSSATSKCARIYAENQPEILVPAESNSSINFQVQNVDPAHEEKLFCIIKGLGQKRVNVRAHMVGSKVECAPQKFSYGVKESARNYSLEFVMGEEIVDKTTITVYKCEEMATDCSQCLSLDPKWGCTWCDSECKYQDFCTNKLSDKLKADMLCKDPVIHVFEPTSGPFEGGTQIEIIGRDLGSRIEDVQDRVIVAGSKCRVIDYSISTKIVCIIEKGTGFGPVRVTIGRSGRRVVESTQFYKFLDPVPKSIYPTFGPVSGGTKLSIFGQNLNVGSNASVFLDNLPCKIVEESEESEQILCTTSPSSRIYTVTAIRLQIDNFVKLFDAKFTYRPDPTIVAINPTTTFESGGRTITVDGTNFDSILMAKMYFLSSVDEPTEIISEFGDCQIHNSSRMHCQSPRLLLSPNHRNTIGATYARWPVGFYMDEVKSVRNLGYRIQMSSVPDPQFLPFKGVKIQAHDQPLIITGNYLSQAASLEEYTVTIGTERCSVFLLDSHQLLCKVPEPQPEATDDAGVELPDGKPMVVVKIGSLRAELGLLEYESSSIALFRMNLMRLLLILLSGVGLLGTAGVLLFLLWKRRSNQHERDYKRIQLQMEQMETNAFAELQTDMTDLTAAIDDVGIPYHEKAEFVSRLLFRDPVDTAILHSWGGGINIYSSQLPNIALAQFDSLLWNRQFVFLMVHMTESNPNITLAERSTLSSLLLTALSRNMGYCTDVILSLLSAHIEHCVNTKTAPLLFRRTESLVEKLFQQWLTISLFPYLNDTTGPGRSFFLLYKALKYQTEKGPVDNVTGNARYSLNEQKLLRESVDAQIITLLIIPVEGFDQAPILCRVLLCDTISQVKSKLLDLLYKNQPFSQRITVDQFDLEWRCPKKGSVLLLDDDRPGTKGLKKLNTVSYYGLPNNALLAMQPRSQNSFTYRSGSSDTTCSAWSSTHLIDSASSPTSNSDTHYYHLTLPSSSSMNGMNRSFDKKKHLFLEHTAPNIPEVYLTRLLTCKGTVQKFVDDFFNSVTFNYAGENNIPLVLKYVMDFLDQEAARHNIIEQDIIQAWKTNALVLRFWMQLIHSPECLFDVQRQNCLDASLTVIGQTLIDAFSRSEHTLGKESPSSKLLFAKDIARYRPIAAEMFKKIKYQPTVNEKIFYDYINSLSRSAGEGVSSTVAVAELLNWVKANGVNLVEMLSRDHIAIRHRLADRLQQIIHCTIAEPEHIYATLQ